MDTPRAVGLWPERMKAATAAAYLDMSVRTFHRRVAKDVERVAGGYRKADLDRWLGRQTGRRPRRSVAA